MLYIDKLKQFSEAAQTIHDPFNLVVVQEVAPEIDPDRETDEESDGDIDSEE